jgi:hypothetical protein
MNTEYHFNSHTFHYIFIHLQRNKGLWLQSLLLHTKRSYVHCEQATDRAVVDFPLPNSDNSVSWRSGSGNVLHILRIMALVKLTIKRSAIVLWFVMSWLLNSCTTTILYGWKFRSLCKILLTLQSDIHRATVCFLAECLWLLMNDCLTASVFCGDSTACTLPSSAFFKAEALVLCLVVFFFNAEALILTVSTHNCMVLQQGTIQWWAILKCL